MLRNVIAILSVVLSVSPFCWSSDADIARVSADSSRGLFRSATSIPVAASVGRGQIGRGQVSHEGGGSSLHSSIPRGAADVFGNGPYDLFVDPQRLFPCQGVDAAGTPLYGKALPTKGEHVHDVFTGPNGVIYGVRASGRQVHISTFNRDTLTFENGVSSELLNVPGGLGGATAFVDADGGLHVYSTIVSQGEYRPEGDHHAATFMPYDGAGIWRGKIPRKMLYHIRFGNLQLDAPVAASRVGKGPGEFLFSVRTLTVAQMGKGRSPAVITTEKQSVLRCFDINESTGRPGSQKFVNNEQHVALRHPAINPSVKAITNPETGQSDLIVGDSGRLWFYRFSGEFAENGSPIYVSPQHGQRAFWVYGVG